jgi:hypothetical protein
VRDLRIEPEWSVDRASRVRHAIARRAAVHRTVRTMTWVVATLALLVATLVRVRRPDEPVAVTTPATATPTPTTPPESTVTALSDGTNVARVGERAYALHAGGARFVVAHDASHPFTVRARDVVIEDVGTVFTVAYTPADRIVVEVESGSVRIHSGLAITDLGAGQRIEVAATVAPDAPAALSPVAPAPIVAKHDVDVVGALLRAADSSRAEGRPEDAVQPLRTVMREHASDARAGVAAFTLGRLLDELHQPSEAADAFASARLRGGPMAEDALAHEVMARARAGEVDKARVLADEYLRLHPQGDRAREVSKFGSTR